MLASHFQGIELPVENKRKTLNSDARSLPPSDEGGGFCEAKDGGRD